jgi:HK97 family phage portal protein
LLDWLKRAFTQAFRLGPDYARIESDWGHDQATYSPPEYGTYIATSVTVYAAARLRAQNLAQLPLKLYKVGRNGAEREVSRGGLARILTKPNPFWTFGRLIRQSELSLCLWGQAFWVLERSGPGLAPTEIWWARSEHMRPVIDQRRYLRGWIYDAGGSRIAFTPDEVIWLRYENPLDEFSPLSPIAAARLSIDSAHGALRANRMIFNNGINLAGMVSPANATDRMQPATVDELNMLLDKKFRGDDKAHRVAVLSHAVKFESVTISPKDAEFLGLLSWSLHDVCRAYQIPPPFMQDFTESTWGNITESHAALWQECVLPEARMLSEELTLQLLPLFPGEADLARFDESKVFVLQEDRTELVQQMVSLAQIGVPLNALLAKYEPSLLPPGGYPWGDIWWAPLNLLPAGSSAPKPAAPPAGGEEDEGAAEAAEQALRLVQSMRLTDDRRVQLAGLVERRNGAH